jgi:hypothetical protein
MKTSMKIAAFVAAMACPLAWAQTAIQPGSIVGTFSAQNYVPANGGSSTVIYTVPGDRAARVTDVLATTYGLSGDPVCQAAITMGGTLFFIRVPRDTYVVVPLQTGYGVTAGGTVTLNPGNCGGNDLYIQIRGFNFTIP